MGRELRKVPMDYKHPLDERGQLQPMYDQTYAHALADWEEEKRQWESRESRHAEPNDYEKYTFEQWHGTAPDPKYYRPEWPEDAVLGIQLWESTSEGSPVSPVFEDSEAGLRALCEWAQENATTFASYKTSAQGWYEMLSAGMVTTTAGFTLDGKRVVFI